MLWIGAWSLLGIIPFAVWLIGHNDEPVFLRMNRLTRTLIVTALFVGVELSFVFGDTAAAGVPPGGPAAGRDLLLILVGLIIFGYVVFSVAVWKSDRNQKRLGRDAPHHNAVANHA